MNAPKGDKAVDKGGRIAKVMARAEGAQTKKRAGND